MHFVLMYCYSHSALKLWSCEKKSSVSLCFIFNFEPEVKYIESNCMSGYVSVTGGWK